MFQFLNKIIRMKHLKKGLKSSDGQVAIILILVIAAALIFYAVSLNLGQFTLSRVLVTIASNTSASMLASNMASYGQALSSSTLDGKREICAWTGVLAAIIVIIIIVIAIIIGIYSSGTGFAAFMTSTGGILATIGLVLAVAALAIQVTVIQPGLTEAWNDIIGATLSLKNQFTEGAIQSAMGKAVTDVVNVPDITDQDIDRLWVPAAALGTLPFADTISRYGMYYTERLRQIKDQVAFVEIAQFIMSLEELLYDGTDEWGLYDPMPGSLCFGRAECHPCCVPDTATIEGDLLTGIRSTDCTDFLSTDDVSWSQVCEPASPYQIGPMGDGGVGEGFPWLFDAYSENPFNIFRSFREEIGFDDEHRDFYKDFADPNSLPAPRASQFIHVIGNEGFRLEDATGFYTDPNPIQTDAFYTGIFPYFYKMADWGVDLANVRANIAADPMSRECHWCDDRDLVNCFTCVGYPPHPHPGEIPQLVLPLDPAIPADGLIYNTTYFVDEANNAVDLANALPQPFPPLAVDRVEFPVPGNIIADDDALTAVCAQSTLYPQPPSQDGFWRRGGDRFCKDAAPYFMECPKCMGLSDCECGIGTDPFDFPDDVLDDIVYSLPDFYEWAQRTIAAASDMASFSDDFPSWYPEAAIWIEPLSPPETACFMCDLTLPDGTPIPEGILWIWFKEITEMRDRLIEWINNYDIVTGTEEGYPGTTCTEVWCVPDSTLVCAEIPAGEGEDATFDANLNGVQGDVVDIVSCLNYNIEGYDHVAAEKFKDCLNNCGVADCTVGVGGTLPAFHLDGVTPYYYPPTILDCISAPGWATGNDWFDAVTENIALAVKPPATLRGNDYRFKKCSMSCSLADCHHLPRSMVPFSRGPIYWPADYQPWDSTIPGPMVAVTADGNWEDLTAFNDCIANCSLDNCMVGPRLPTVHTSDGVTPYVYPAGVPDCLTWFVGDPWYDGIVALRNSIKLVDEFDMIPMLSCFDDCTANIANCQAMPVNQSSTGLPYPGGWPAAPATFAPANCVGWVPGNPWYDAIVANVLTAGGPICDLNVDQWLYSTRQSAIEAINQIAKFTHRRNFLSARLAETAEILNVFGEDIDDDGKTDTGVIEKLETFLDGSAADLIDARINYLPVSGDTGLPYQAIYGWRDEDIIYPSGITRRGFWHIVKVEARIPGMCDDRCSWSQSTPDPGWPRIKSYTKNWGTRRCYRLTNTEGSVKFRTTRWDEDKSSKPCEGLTDCPADCGSCAAGSTDTYRKMMRFPNGTPIWSFKGNNPLRPSNFALYNPDQLDGVCRPYTITELPGTIVPTTIYEGAFILKEHLPGIGVGPYALPVPDPCWDLAHGFLAQGVVNETCARYFWGDNGMGLEFVRCEEF